jgi:regulator of sigma E protease
MMQGTVGLKPEVADVADGTAASTAQIHKGDRILNIAGEDVKLWQDIQWILVRNVFKSASVEVQTIDSDQQKHTRRIDLTGINESDLNADFLAKLGLKPSRPVVEPIIGSVIKSSAADKAGLQSADKILAVNGTLITDWESLVNIIQDSPNKMLNLSVERSNQILMLRVTPSSINKNGQLIGQIGAAVFMDENMMRGYLITNHLSTLESLMKAVQKTYETSAFSLKMLGNMLTGDVSIKSISGPVTIATYAGQSANLGLNAFIAFLAVISISLGVLNLLPIPVLDGGHLLYYMVELVKGSPVSERTMEIGQRIGLTVLGLLMVCALYNDINRLIVG